jgi:hypothetical protein
MNLLSTSCAWFNGYNEEGSGTTFNIVSVEDKRQEQLSGKEVNVKVFGNLLGSEKRLVTSARVKGEQKVRKGLEWPHALHHACA